MPFRFLIGACILIFSNFNKDSIKIIQLLVLYPYNILIDFILAKMKKLNKLKAN